MPVISPNALKERYDVVIVGSGAGGGQTAYVLTLEGAKVLMLEAGAFYDPSSAAMFQPPTQAPLRGAGTPDKSSGFHAATMESGWQIAGEPYTTESGSDFQWFRVRMLGGRTNHWQRMALRYGPYDFKPKTRDSLGLDWPIAYEELAPYYDKVEMLVGVFGSNEGLENSPDSSPGCLLPPPRPTVSDLLFRQRAQRLGIPVVPNHKAILTQRLDYQNLPEKLHPGNVTAQRVVRDSMASRAACFWATPCGNGCSIRATYQSPTVHLPPAMATGNLDVVCQAMVREVTLGHDGKARGVTFIDKTTGNEHHAAGRVVILAAGACESVRLLLNSKSAHFPNGLANSSGCVGKSITGSVASSVRGQIPLLENLPPHNEDGADGLHVYAPWWLYAEQLEGKLDFARGYHIAFRGGTRRMPNHGTAAGLEWLTNGSYGHRFKKDARRYFGSFVTFSGVGEMIPNEGTYCEIDPIAKDKWGIPVLRFHWKWSEHETRQVAHQQKTFAAIIDAMGGRVQGPVETDGAKAIRHGGAVWHEVGGAVMGDDPKTSVTNRWGQAHDVPNLVIGDGAAFASHASKNPTLTILALAWRAAEHVAEEMKKMNL